MIRPYDYDRSDLPAPEALAVVGALLTSAVYIARKGPEDLINFKAGLESVRQAAAVWECVDLSVFDAGRQRVEALIKAIVESLESAQEARRIYRHRLTPAEANALPGNAWVMAQITLAAWAAQELEARAGVGETLKPPPAISA